jgi:hypothetical protein
MRFLLTSAGIKNASIHDALVDLLGKPIPESGVLPIAGPVLDVPVELVLPAQSEPTDRAALDRVLS